MLVASDIGNGLNANCMVWGLDPRDFGGPEGYPVGGPGAVVGLQALHDMVGDQLVPAAEQMQRSGQLYGYLHQQVTAVGFPTPDNVLQYVALALTEGDAAAAAQGVVLYAQRETERLAQFTAEPWRLPFQVHSDLSVLQAAFSHLGRPLAEVLEDVPVADPWVWPGGSSKLPEPQLRSTGASVIYPREGYAEELWRYGESDFAVAMLDADDDTYRRVMTLAASPTALRDDSRASVSMAEMCALGAIEVLAGVVRFPTRKRRLPQASLHAFWEKVGPHRDVRGDDDGMSVALRVADEG